jgi:serine/threonine protein kinase
MALDYVGHQIGNYRLVQLLGKGGFAHVYRGEHTYLHSQAALKILQVTLSEKEMSRFQQEAQTLVKLLHPHIVRVLDFFLTDGVPVLVMEYAAGGTIRQCHARGSRLPLPAVVDYAQQIGEALQYAHTHGIIHRDIKPDNILLDDNKNLLLSDFGLALFTPSPEQLSVQDLAGTLYYMAPEQLRGKPTFASDQYSLAVMVYEWLSGACPFAGSYWELMHQHMDIAPQSLRNQRPELHPNIEKVVMKALAKDPQERFATVLDFAQALKTASQEKQISWPDSRSNWKENSTVPMPVVASPASNEADRVSFSGNNVGTQASSAMSPSHIHSQGKIAQPYMQPIQSVSSPVAIYLSASDADAPIVSMLESDLKSIGIINLKEDGHNSRSWSLQSSQASGLQQTIQQATSIVVLVSSYTRTTPAILEHMRLATIYQRRVVCIWIEGDEITTVLPVSNAQFDNMMVIDARSDLYISVVQKLVTYLKSTNIAQSHNPMLSSPLLSFSNREPMPYVLTSFEQQRNISTYNYHTTGIVDFEHLHVNNVQIKDIVATVRARSLVSQPLQTGAFSPSSHKPREVSTPVLTATHTERSVITALKQKRKQIFLTALLIIAIFLMIIPWARWRINQHHLVVNTSSDVGAGSLRQVLAEAEPGDIISFDNALKGKVITIDQSTLTIDKSVTVNGTDGSSIALSTGKSGYSIHITAQASVTLKNITLRDSAPNHRSLLFNQGNLTLVNTTLANNTISASSYKGRQSAVISNRGTLTLQNSRIEGNNITACAGSSSIYNTGQLNIQGGSIFNNKVVANCLQTGTSKTIAGSGINNASTGTVSLTKTVIANNTASGAGGGIANSGRMTISDSMIASNKTVGPGGGGGIFNQGTLTIQNSSVNENTAEISPQDAAQYVERGESVSSGGGINNAGNLIMLNSTISENVVTTTDGTQLLTQDAPLLLAGGGIFNDEGNATLDFCTIYGNNAQNNGGGIFIDNDTAHRENSTLPVTTSQVHIKNSIVAANKANDIPDIAGSIITGGYNLIQATIGTQFSDPTHMHHTDITNVQDDMLHIDEQSHRYDGQVSIVHTLLPNSPAIDRIPLAACDLHSDQRHIQRPQGPRCDIGAFEYDTITP